MFTERHRASQSHPDICWHPWLDRFGNVGTKYNYYIIYYIHILSFTIYLIIHIHLGDIILMTTIRTAFALHRVVATWPMGQVQQALESAADVGIFQLQLRHHAATLPSQHHQTDLVSKPWLQSAACSTWFGTFPHLFGWKGFDSLFICCKGWVELGVRACVGLSWPHRGQQIIQILTDMLRPAKLQFGGTMWICTCTWWESSWLGGWVDFKWSEGNMTCPKPNHHPTFSKTCQTISVQKG